MHISTDAHDERVDLLLEEIAESEDAAERSTLLLDLADLLDRGLGDPERALRAAHAALEERPQSTAASDRCIALYERMSRWNDLANFLSDRVEQARSDGEERAPLARRLAELAETRLGDPGRAIPAWRHVLAEKPADREALSALARLFGGAGRLRERLQTLVALVDATESPRERAALHRELSAGFQDLGRLEEAAEHLEWALAHDTGKAEDYRSLGSIYLMMGRVHAAINAHVRRADLLHGAERAAAYLEIAALYEGARKDISRAIDFCLSAEDAAPGQADARRTLVRLYEQQGEHESAVSALERWAELAAEGPTDRAAILARAGRIAHQKLADADEANRLFSAALESSPSSVAAMRGLCALCRERGELGRAARFAIDALAVSDAPEERAALAFEAAQLHEQLGDRAGATAFYRDALDSDPAMSSAAARLADLLWTDEQWSELIPLLEELTRSGSDREALKTRLVRLCRAYRSVGLDRRAIGAAARALELAPEDQELHRLNADLLFDCKMWSEASRALEPLLAGPPTSTGDRVALLHRAGVCAARMGQTAPATGWARRSAWRPATASRCSSSSSWSAAGRGPSSTSCARSSRRRPARSASTSWSRWAICSPPSCSTRPQRSRSMAARSSWRRATTSWSTSASRCWPGASAGRSAATCSTGSSRPRASRPCAPSMPTRPRSCARTSSTSRSRRWRSGGARWTTTPT